jgi:glutamyl/glutaminyl-tRNA synthetase
VRGWDDPRLATINGLRRRGYTPEAINAFCRDIGVSRSENMILTSRLDFHLREHLDVIAKRAFAVLRPLKVTLLDVPEGEVRWLEAPDFPRDKALGSHRIALSRVVYIEQDDFRCVCCMGLSRRRRTRGQSCGSSRICCCGWKAWRSSRGGFGSGSGAGGRWEVGPHVA